MGDGIDVVPLAPSAHRDEIYFVNFAGVVKLADTLALGANGETLGGSNPSIRTMNLFIKRNLQNLKHGIYLTVRDNGYVSIWRSNYIGVK